MKKILICTIMRDVKPSFSTWFWSIIRLRSNIKAEYDVTLSVYENDSVDDTDKSVRENLKVLANDYQLDLISNSEKLNTKKYGSVWHIDRLRNLAQARQKCLDQAGDLSRFDKIAFIEPDVTYDYNWCMELILARHPIAAGLGEPDIYSGWSLRSEKHPKESTYLYDTCATRQEKEHTEWRFDLTDKWRGESLIRTDLGGVDNNCLHSVWSTFNCFCVYNAKPFIEGLKWGYINNRLNTGQEYIRSTVQGEISYLDADTSVMCEKFRAAGYEKILLNTNCLVRHS